jgi:hypothetical protein
MGWFKNFIFIFSAIMVYLHIFIHFKINIYNEFNSITDVCKDNILSCVYYKLPFVFDGSTIIKPYDLKQCSKNKNDKFYTKTYESMPMLEPGVKFFTKNTIYELSKPDKKIDIHSNLYCRNFYLVHSGKASIYCIHPKYKEHLNSNKNDKTDKTDKTDKIDKNVYNKNTYDFIEKNDQILHLELSPNSILFIPNYWYISIKALEKNTVIEKLQYKTILNEVNFLYAKYIC